MKRLLVASALAFLASCGSASDSKPSLETEAAPTEPTGTLPELVAVDQIAVYQATKVTLVDERAVVRKPGAPIVPERPALVRVHAKSLARRARIAPLVAELRVHVAGRPDVVVTDGPKKLVELDDADLRSTFTFDLAGEAIAPGATLDVTVRDPGAPDGPVVRFPEEPDATVSMNVGAVAPTLRVKFVPVRYEADGSGRLPDVSEQTMAHYRDWLYALYPASRIEVGVREPMRWPLALEPGGDGWEELLDAVVETRSDDHPPDDVYYIALLAPAPTQHDWCSQGYCVLGIAPQTLVRDVFLRVAMVTSYPGNEGTLAQELAHAMGRMHAPCGRPDDIDPDYPYARASIGVWGWDVVKRALVDPDRRIYDFMSYCGPNWVSDYTFAGLYERMELVEKAKRPEGVLLPSGGAGGREAMVQIGRVRPDGTTRPGPRVRAGGAEVEGGVRKIAGLPGVLRVTPVR